MRDKSNMIEAEKLFRVLGEKTRIQIVKACIESAQSTSQLLTKTGLDKTLLSKHLNVLRKSKVLFAEKSGRSMTYSINKAICHKSRKHTLALFCCNIELK